MGLHVIVEHRIPDKGTFYSIYGHLGAVAVSKGQDVLPGTMIGTVGMTGKTTAPHLHLQIDRGEPGGHERFWPGVHMAAGDALERTVHPIHFIAQHSAAAMTLAER